MAEQQMQEPQFGKTDLRSTLVSLSANIVLGAKSAGSATGYNSECLSGWGSEIMAFDSLISVMVKEDVEFFKKRDKIKKEISVWKPRIRNKYNEPRSRLFDAYNEWFALLCTKMPIYPEQSTSVVLENVIEDEEGL